jgi:disulfide bond formation protein DsbB
VTTAAAAAARWAVLVWAGAAAAVGTALTLELGFGVEPCHLCLYERVPYYAILGLLPVAAALGRPRLGLALAGVLLLGNAGLSAYHVAVEQGLAALPTSCVAGGEAATLEELRAQIMGAAPTCDRVSVSFLGLSLAAWNGLFAAALGLAALRAAFGGRSAREQDRQVRAA